MILSAYADNIVVGCEEELEGERGSVYELHKGPVLPQGLTRKKKYLDIYLGNNDKEKLGEHH